MTEKEPHLKVGEWLLKMGYPKDKFPSEEELKKVCRGSIYRCFWKQVVKDVKPKKEIMFVKENIFVESIRRYEKVEQTSKAKLRQVLPPEPLLLWKKIKEKESALINYKVSQEKSEHDLKDKLLTLKMKSYEIVQMKKELEDKKREIHLMNEAKTQLQKDIEQSKYLIDLMCNVPCLKERVKEIVENNKEIDVLADFLSATSLKSPENVVKIVEKNKNDSSDPFDNMLLALKDDDSNVNVEEVMRNISVCELFNKLMTRRKEMMDAIVKDNRIEEELKGVEDDAHNRGILPWKESLLHLHQLHCNVVVATLQNRRELQQLITALKNALFEKIGRAKLPEQTLEVIKLKCQYADFNAQIVAYKDFYDELFNGSDLFPINTCVRPSNTCMGESIVNIREDIVSLYSMYSANQAQVLENINKLTEGIGYMKELRKSFTDFMGHSEFGSFERNESLNISFFNANSTFKTSITKSLKNLMDVKHLFTEANNVQQIKQDIFNVCKIQQREIKMLNEFDLSRNRRVVFTNGAKIWVDELMHGFQKLDFNEQHTLFKFINPLQTTTGIVQTLLDKIIWKKSLEDLSILIDAKQPKSFPFKEGFPISLDEESDPRIDLTLKSSKKCSKPIFSMHESIKTINRNINFFKKTDFRKYISTDRKFEGKTYYELEDEIKRILAEEAYWNQ